MDVGARSFSADSKGPTRIDRWRCKKTGVERWWASGDCKEKNVCQHARRCCFRMFSFCYFILTAPFCYIGKMERTSMKRIPQINTTYAPLAQIPPNCQALFMLHGLLKGLTCHEMYHKYLLPCSRSCLQARKQALPWDFWTQESTCFESGSNWILTIVSTVWEEENIRALATQSFLNGCIEAMGTEMKLEFRF